MQICPCFGQKSQDKTCTLQNYVILIIIMTVCSKTVFVCDAYLPDLIYEPSRDKTNKVSVRPAKTQISLGIRPVWSESSLSAWRKLGPLATHWAHSQDSDQTRRMPRLICVFAGRTATLLVLSPGGSYLKLTPSIQQLQNNEFMTLSYIENLEWVPKMSPQNQGYKNAYRYKINQQLWVEQNVQHAFS